ncbi:MAG: VWA domain-containing protein [Bacteroidetes bacterium]|nr:VWA domain-containing protein [Bacteroidota bacterium]
MPIQQKISKIKGIADIVFCIDFSGSMSDCIAGVKDHISRFVSSLEAGNPNMVIDWRIGFCGYSDIDFVKYDFTKDVRDFSEKLAVANTEGGDEFTPGAIDFCISDFNWRPVSNKFLIVFTDESLTTGGSEELISVGKDKFPDLLNKISESHIRFFFFGPDCPYYKQFQTLSRTFVTTVNGSFGEIDFSTLLSSLGKTVSQSCSGQSAGGVSKPDFVYDLSSIKVKLL